MTLTQVPWLQIGLLVLEASLVSLVLLALFRLRPRLGFSPLYISLGTLQLMQVLLAQSVYVEILPGLLISPGSAVLFPASLFAILLVYLRHDASEARTLVYGLILANVALALLSYLFGLHLQLEGSRNLLPLPAEILTRNPRILIAGTAALLVDVLLIIVIYERIARWLRRSVLVKIYLTMVIVLAVDSILFSVAGFAGRPEFRAILVAGILGKCVMALPYATLLTGFLRLEGASTSDTQDLAIRGGGFDPFRPLSFRQRYEEAREMALRDSLTGLYNRRFFDEVLPLSLERARRSKSPTSLLMMDIDGFKAINDRYGHPLGDTMLCHVATALKASLRDEDVVCRYGGDEFAAILPNADAGAAKALSRRIALTVAEKVVVAEKLKTLQIRLTIGRATFPDDAADAAGLVEGADQDLYRRRRSFRQGPG